MTSLDLSNEQLFSLSTKISSHFLPPFEGVQFTYNEEYICYFGSRFKIWSLSLLLILVILVILVIIKFEKLCTLYKVCYK